MRLSAEAPVPPHLAGVALRRGVGAFLSLCLCGPVSARPRLRRPPLQSRMDSVQQTLRAAGHPPRPRAARPHSVFLVGAAGGLGSAVLEQLLGRGRFAAVRVLVTQHFEGSVRSLQPLLPGAVDDAVSGRIQLADLAIVVFDRSRHANGRDEAFVRAEPQALPALATRLRQGAVRDLIVVLPHAPALLPEALKRGLAGLDEQAVAALGFEHLVFVRSARHVEPPEGRALLQRLAEGMLSQLRLMLPAAQQPVQVNKVAAFVAELAAQLPASPPGTRVVPPEVIWQAARADDQRTTVADWLAGAELPPLDSPRMRL